MALEPSARTAQTSTSTASQTPIDSSLALRMSIEAFRDRVKGGLSALRAVHKAVSGLLGKSGLEDVRAIESFANALTRAKLDDLGLATERDALVEALRAHQERRRARLRVGLVESLQGAAAGEGLELIQVGDSPPALFIAPVTVTLDFEAGQAELAYARERVLGCDLDARAILEGRREAMREIRSQAIDSKAFFDLLVRAYGMVLAASGRAFGERVDLVDLRAPLALVRAGVDRWRRLRLEKTPPYERYHLAYQLQRLRRDGLLERDGLRLDLGTATGGTTRKKSNVLFVPQVGDEGQYYLSLRLVKSP